MISSPIAINSKSHFRQKTHLDMKRGGNLVRWYMLHVLPAAVNESNRTILTNFVRSFELLTHDKP